MAQLPVFFFGSSFDFALHYTHQKMLMKVLGSMEEAGLLVKYEKCVLIRNAKCFDNFCSC